MTKAIGRNGAQLLTLVAVASRSPQALAWIRPWTEAESRVQHRL